MSGILFLAHRVPFPPDRGDKIRSHHVLRALAKLAPVHVGCLAEGVADAAHERELASVAASYAMPRRQTPLILAATAALAKGRPVSLTAFREPRLHEWIHATLAHGDIDTIYAFSGQMGQYVPRDWRGRLIVDLVDVDSLKFEAYAKETRWPLNRLYAREARLLAAEEARLADMADRTLLVSEAEAQLFRGQAGQVGRVEALGNGIDAAAFDPARVTPAPALAQTAGPHLVFTGQMDYPPNVAAALRTIEILLPAIRRVHPAAAFHVVGRAPVAELRARHGRDGVQVWGEVPDVRPFLAAADLVVAPLTIARGVQNKVLEAMAMARPVLLTPAAATGIEGRDGVHYAVAESDEALIERAKALLSDPPLADAIGTAARQQVLATRSWCAMLARLPEIVGRAGPEAARDAA